MTSDTAQRIADDLKVRNIRHIDGRTFTDADVEAALESATAEYRDNNGGPRLDPDDHPQHLALLEDYVPKYLDLDWDDVFPPVAS